ncbi:DUF192 domain-containing protein [Roseobacter ponti]|uniref:DUF192 domain-containing protein n=1 Tax=Roseobacter ponti TaxID=1891787 RepID=A0A858SSN9_9RHOB|nr:DUF192 domain-containing protein [Roseobacter ponti]QJF50938.1 DUF192 domain-containing protein [Roseobacter ponti]
MRLCALAIFLFLFTATGLAAQCREDAVMLRGDWGEARFAVEIADDDSERAQGLMHRPSMPLSAGMLFIYERPQRLSFWMRNTLIPLDLLFIDPQGQVQHIHHLAVPLDETPIPGGDGLTHVLEINGGLARRMGITEGSFVRHPSFDQGNAVWPC